MTLPELILRIVVVQRLTMLIQLHNLFVQAWASLDRQFGW
jgi:hypothetical protein